MRWRPPTLPATARSPTWPPPRPKPAQPPTAPTNLTATAVSQSQINLSWTASTANVGITGYLVYRENPGSTTYVEVGTTSGSTTTYSDTGLAASSTYSYEVEATDSAGNSPFSNVATATTQSPTQPPTAPTNLTATAVSASQINLSWTASTATGGVTSYLVYRENPGSTTFVQVGTTSGTTTTYSDTGLAAGSTYSYEVEATDSAGNSPFSNVATATTQAAQPPTAPTNLTATAVSSSQINLGWTASTANVGITGYLVYRENPGSSTFVQVGTTSGITTYSDTGLAASSTYSYEVQATDSAGNSPFSNVATATTAATNPGLVAAYAFNEGTGTTVYDSSGNGNNGTITNATWTTSGKYGDALVFNGTNALVTIPDAASLHLTTGMTLEAWVNPSTITSAWTDVVYKGNDNYYLEAATPTSKFPAAGATVGTSDVATYGTAALATSTWAFLTETYNGSTLSLYVNGTLVSSLAEAGSLTTSTNPLQIGGDSIYSQYFKGTIDEVRVYKVALTAAQIQSDMNTAISTQPTAPTNLTATAVSQSQINLSWTASTDTVPVTGYLVYRENLGGTTFVQVGTTTGTTYSDTGLAAGSTYSYEVQATDSAGNLSPFSSMASATTQAPVTQPPTVPTNLTATALSSSQIGLSWTASSSGGVSSYVVYRESPGSSTFVQVGMTNGTTTTYTDGGLAASSTYIYEVEASNAFGNSPSPTWPPRRPPHRHRGRRPRPTSPRPAAPTRSA